MGLTLRRAGVALVALVLACETTPVPLARADGPSASAMAEAKMRYERGLKLYDEGNYDAARVEMQRAYELAPAYKILYNLGLVHRQLNDYAAALKAFQQYLVDGGKKIDGKRRAEVDKSIADLKGRVAMVTVQVDKPGAEVSVDEAVIGTSPLSEPLMVNAGKRRFSAKLPGRPAGSKVVTLAGGDTATVQIELTEPVVVEKPVSAPPPVAPQRSYTVVYVAWAATGALAVGAGVSATFLFFASRDLSTLKSSAEPARADLDATASRSKTWAIVTDVFLATTLVAGGVSLYLTLRSPKESATGSRLLIGATPARGGGMFTLSAGF